MTAPTSSGSDQPAARAVPDGRAVPQSGRRRWSRTWSSPILAAGLVATSLIGLPPGGTPAQAAILSVCASGCDHTSIQAAINAAGDGDTITVGAGVYQEQLLIGTPNVTITGAGIGQTTLQPLLNDQAWDVKFTASGATLEGFTLDFNGADGTREGRGIAVSDFDGPVAENVTITDNDITMGVGTGRSTIGLEGVGIQTGVNAEVSGLTISDNTFRGGTTEIGDGATKGEEGIFVNPRGTVGTGSITISGNTFEGELFVGISVFGDGVTVTGNTISRPSLADNTHGIRTNNPSTIANNTISGGFANGLRLGPASAASTTIMATGNDVRGTTVGMLVRQGGDVTASDNAIVGNTAGAVLEAGGTLNAINNWWGAASGPSGVGPGTGDTVSAGVTYDPWCTNLACTTHSDDPAPAPAPVDEDPVATVDQPVTAGGTVTNDPDDVGPTTEVPITAAVTSPNAGDVTLEVREPTASEEPDGTGFTLFGTVVDVTAPDATVADPLAIAFSLHASLLPADLDVDNLIVFRDGQAVGDCTMTTGEAVPDPCVASAAVDADGNLDIEVLTSRASVWSFAVATAACPSSVVPDDGFTDDTGVHGTSIACAAWWDLAVGFADGTFGSSASLTRAQAASFIAHLLEAAGVALPSDAVDAFGDDDGSTHEAAIDQLASLGIVSGVSEERFAPGEHLRRAQMASILVGATEHVVGDLPPGVDAFADDDGSIHESAIDKVAAAGFTVGVAPEQFDPSGEVSRGQAASFLTRVLDRFFADGVVTLPN